MARKKAETNGGEERLPRGQTRIQWAFGREKMTGNSSLTVPAAMARLVGPNRVFAPELTEEGILFRFVEGGDPVELPAWLR